MPPSPPKRFGGQTDLFGGLESPAPAADMEQRAAVPTTDVAKIAGKRAKLLPARHVRGV